MSFFFGRKTSTGDGGGGGGGKGAEHTGRNLQDGLFQIASQACHILVQVSRRSSRGGTSSLLPLSIFKRQRRYGEDVYQNCFMQLFIAEKRIDIPV